MSQSLGYRRGADHNSDRPGEIRASRTQPSSVAVAIPVVSKSEEKKCCTMVTAKGFIPVLLCSLLFLSIPLVYEYSDMEYDKAGTRGGVIATAGVASLLVLLSNDCGAWYNYVLFAHIGIEVKVLDILQEFARADLTRDGDTRLAWIAFVVIILHLIPFLLTDHVAILSLLAYTGVVLNASVLVFLDPARLLLVGVSSTVLLGSVMCMCSMCNVRTSMLTCLVCAIKERSWCSCSLYVM